jgi:CubicO group peptidase (beta-lactamase class C family)
LDLYEFLSSYTLPRDPGDKYEYSNAGAGLLGQILARLADKSYEQLVVDRISQPLGLNDTRITLSEEQRNRFARGHLGDGREVGNWEFDSLAGAGALRSSAADLARFVAANLGLYKTDLYAALKRTHQVRADAGAPGAEIGLGWHAGMVYGAQIVGHDGGTGGYRSSCNFIPSRNVGAVVLSNSNFDIGYISTHLLEPQVPLRRVLKPIPVAPGVLAGYAGTYEVVPGSMGASAVLINVAVANEILMVQLTGEPTYPVYPATETVFYYRVANTFIQFQKDDKGNVVGLILYTEGIPFEAKKIK